MQISNFPSHCGSAIFHQLYDTQTGWWPIKHNYRTFFGIFVDTPDQKKTYKSLNKRFKILYQSPVLVNPGTKREYFIVIWLNEKP